MTKTVLSLVRRQIQFAAVLGLAGALMGQRGICADQTKVDFARDIQPIFVKRCYECHGPDKQKSDLRLDKKMDALRGVKSGKPLLLAGQSAKSEIIERITTADEDERMPSKGAPLSPEQIASLRAWID